MTSPTDRAQRLADDVLFPKANAVDRSGEVPTEQLDRITSEGLYGLVGPSELGGAGVDGHAQLQIIETLASGCLTTCFVWLQHQNALGLAAQASGDLHQRWAAPLATGQVKAGVAFAHLLRPAVVISAERHDPGDPNSDWILNGIAPWVTGWGSIQIVSVAARADVKADTHPSGLPHGRPATGPGNVVWLFVDAVAAPSLQATRLELSAINSSGTYSVEFRNHRVPADRVARIEPYSKWLTNYGAGLRVNASLGLGLCVRTLGLLDRSGAAHTFGPELESIRQRLDSVSPEKMPKARADLSTLAVRMTAGLVATIGGRSVMLDETGQRLAREAVFLLIQGQTAEIKRHQISGLGG